MNAIWDLEERAGRLIREIRLLGCLSQKDLARLPDISSSIMADHERGRGSSIETFRSVLRGPGRVDDVLEHLEEHYSESTPMKLLRVSKRKPMRAQRAPKKPSRTKIQRIQKHIKGDCHSNEVAP
ncbi:hypothetical protein GCM10009628_42340 [Paeniglutamicibacter kerguelensis]